MPTEFRLNANDGRDVTPEIIDFVGLDRIAAGRYSKLLLLQIYGGAKSGHQNSAKIIREIEALEGYEPASLSKPPAQFNYPPLKGLWHKHYLQDELASFAMNVEHGLKKYGIPVFKRRCLEARKGNEKFLSPADIPIIVNDVLSGNWGRLAQNHQLTGEWIIFSKYQDKNYYLCLGSHDKATHEEIRREIDAICCKEFPFIKKQLET